MQRTAAAIVDDLLQTGPCDFVQHVSARLPLKIICEMMGIGDEHYEMVLQNTNIILSGADPEFISEDMNEAITQILTAGQDLADAGHRPGRAAPGQPGRRPGLGAGHRQHRRRAAHPAELASFFILLVVAGNETTRTAISHALLLLTEHPDQRELLLADVDGRIGARRRGDRPLRLAGDLDAPHGDPRHRDERARLPRGRQGRAVLPGGQPRRVGVRRPGPVRHHPLPQPARRLRRRRARTSASARTWPAGRSPPCCASC